MTPNPSHPPANFASPQKVVPIVSREPVSLARRAHFVCSAMADPRLSRADQSVLTVIILRYFNDDKRAAWPALDTLAIDTGLSRRSLSRAVSSLQTAGYLVVKAGAGTRSSNYQLGTRYRGEAYQALHLG